MHHVRIHLPWTNQKSPPLFRQTPNNSGRWKNAQFYLNHGEEPCDFLVVFAGHRGLIKENIPKEHTLFIAGEPPAIKKYSEAYLAQFGSVICSDTKTSHPKKKIDQQGYPWFCGLKFLENENKVSVKSYDDFKQDTEIKKTKLISVVCSDKQSKPGHRKRFEFVQKLKEAFGDEMDLFGTGQNPIADKSEAIRPYKYHIAIENSVAPDYWTEKLSDCYLEEAYPFYAGCPNVDKYFSTNAYSIINLDDPNASINLIRNAIATNHYETALSHIQDAKRQVLDEYNLFNLITDHIDKIKLRTTPTTIKAFQAYPSKWFTKGPFYRLKFRLSN